MKSLLKMLVPAFALGLLASSLVRAEDEAGPPPGPPPANQPPPPGGRGGRGGRGGGMMDPAARVKQLDAVLKLTDDQKSKITAIFQKDQEQMQALRGGTPRDQMRSKMEDIQKSTKDQIRALLTDDQKTKFDAMPPPPGPGGRGGGGRRRGGAGGGDAGTPPPPPAPPAN